MKRDDATPDLFSMNAMPRLDSPSPDKKTAARAKRDGGMRRATDHADSVSHAWSTAAFVLLHRFAAATSGTFTVEDVRQFAALQGLVDPPDTRAWGTITMRAARAGFIVKAGFAEAKNPDAHCRPARLWRSTI